MIALVMNTTTHTAPVSMRFSPAARGLAPVANSFRPGTVRCRKTPTVIATTAQMTTIGGVERPAVAPAAEGRALRNGGADPVSLPAVHATAPPALIAPMPRVTISGWMRQRWQIQPVVAPRAPEISTATAMAGAADQWCAP